MSTIRAFVAIEPGDATRAWLESVLDSLASRFAAVRRVRPENAPLTLRFLGDIEAGGEDERNDG